MTRLARFRSNVLAVAYREAIIVRHDKAFIGVVVLQPIMMLFLLGYVLSNKPANVAWVVLDRSATPASRQVVHEVQATGCLPPRSVASYDQGRAVLRRGGALAFLVIPRDFALDAARGRPRVQPCSTAAIRSAARVGGYVISRGHPAAVRPAPVRVAGNPGRTPGPIDVRQRFWFNATLSDREFFLSAIAGMLLTNLCFSVTALAGRRARERHLRADALAPDHDARDRAREAASLRGRVLPAPRLRHPGDRRDLRPLAGGQRRDACRRDPTVRARPLTIGVRISVFARASAQAIFLTVFFILPSFILSGMLFPYQFMPPGVRELGAVLPLRWYSDRAPPRDRARPV